MRCICRLTVFKYAIPLYEMHYEASHSNTNSPDTWHRVLSNESMKPTRPLSFLHGGGRADATRLELRLST